MVNLLCNMVEAHEARRAELELLTLINSCPACDEREVRATFGDKYGIVITWEGAHVGIWGWVDGALGFRTLANWEPCIIAVDANAALAATMTMAEERNWTR